MDDVKIAIFLLEDRPMHMYWNIKKIIWIEEISQKFNFPLKGTVSEQFLKAFWALNEWHTRSIMKKFQNEWCQNCNFSSRGPPLFSEIFKIHLNVQVPLGNELVWGKVYKYLLKPRKRFIFNNFFHICLIKKFYFKIGVIFEGKIKKN